MDLGHLLPSGVAQDQPVVQAQDLAVDLQHGLAGSSVISEFSPSRKHRSRIGYIALLSSA